MTNGFIKIPRSLLEDPHWISSRLKHKAIFVLFLELACYRPQKHDIRGHAIDLKPGQLCYSMRKLADLAGPDCTKEDIEGAIKRFSKTPKFLLQQVLHKKSLITILNYDTYIQRNVTTPPTTPPRLRQDSAIKEERKERKEDHHPYPSSSNQGNGTGIEDFSSSPSFSKDEQAKIEVYPGVELTQKQLDDCIAIKGSLVKVKDCVEMVMRSPGRKFAIYDWPHTLETWNFNKPFTSNVRANESMAIRLSELYEHFTPDRSWRCSVSNDKKRDVRGILFECNSAHVATIFVAFTDGEFKQKVTKLLRANKMQRSRIAKT